ncbi:kinase-like protein [Auricularia subglabra TFB-10046 SS5]|nr:kinase-like protein [Auricularia subglabra TFB-10046 SS5]
MSSHYDDHRRPELYITGEISQVARRRNGAFADVSPVKIVGWSSKVVALKRPRYSDDESLNQKMILALEKEITALQLVTHPHIIKFHGLIREFAMPCIVMPWLEKGNLRQHLKGNPSVDKRSILGQIADALAHLHSGSATVDKSIIIHGDIHAGNILIDDRGNALLGDFGLCKLVAPGDIASLSQRRGIPDGVILYMAPELHDAGARRSTASDVFAFGILISETYNSGNVPALTSHPNGDNATINALRLGDRPLQGQGMGTMWKLACDCWAASPAARPGMRAVHARIKGHS